MDVALTCVSSIVASSRPPTIVDWEIFVVKKFSPVAWAAKMKRAKIKYTDMCFIAEPSGGEN